MEYHEDIDQEKGMNEERLLDHPSKSLGGVRTLPFILANEGFEKAAYYGLLPNMILYLMGVYGLDMATGSNIIFLWCAATNFTPILGAFLADAYAGRFQMIAFGCVSSMLGMMLLWSTTIIPGVTPSHDKVAASNSTTCATLIQLVYICTGLGLMSIGSGGIRSSSMAFGADQLLSNGNPGGKRSLETFVSWYYFCSISAMVFALTCIVYIQDHFGWQIGFAIPVSLMFLSALCFFSASSFYLKKKPMSSIFTSLSQVVVASWRNRHYQFSTCLGADTVYHVGNGSILLVPTQKLRFLNKACIVKDQQDVSKDGIAKDPWRLCTIDQVEDFKAIINVIPIWSTGIMLAVTHSCVSSFLVIQAKSMDRHFITSTFEIPCASFGTFALSSVLLWIVLYDRVFIPLASKVMGKPVGINVIIRMGIGLLLSFICMVVAGTVENARRGSAIGGNLVKPMSALWLVPQVCLVGLAEGITSIAQIEFFYSKFPRSMSSISVNLVGFGIGISSLLSSFIVSVINYVTKQDGAESWISSDPNKGHYDYFYWVVAGLSLLNFIYFLVCSRSYRE